MCLRENDVEGKKRGKEKKRAAEEEVGQTGRAAHVTDEAWKMK